VDIGNIYRAYAFWMNEVGKKEGDYIFESEANILYHLLRL